MFFIFVWKLISNGGVKIDADKSNCIFLALILMTMMDK